jgi:hypothetical protein
MPRRKLGAHLWLQPAYRQRHGHFEPAVWRIKDCRYKHSTGLGLADCRSAYPKRHLPPQPSRQGSRRADQVAIGEVIGIISPLRRVRTFALSRRADQRQQTMSAFELAGASAEIAGG